MRRVSRAIAIGAVVTLAVVLASCGGSGKTGKAGNKDDKPALPAECVLPTFTAHVVRDGGLAAGSPTYEVIGAAAVQIPLVPDKAQTLTYEQSIQMGETTDLIGYGLLFGDEAFGVDDVSLFDGYTPEAAGKTRGVVSIYPHTQTPLAVGDVITSQPMEGLGMFSTINNLGMDFKTTPDEYTAYSNSIRGSVTIIGLTDQAICLKVDLAWDASDISTSATGTLTIKGIFTAPLTERTLPLG